MSGINSVPPLPHTPTYDPLGRAMTEDQKTRLQEQPSKPVEQTDAKERLTDRRRELVELAMSTRVLVFERGTACTQVIDGTAKDAAFAAGCVEHRLRLRGLDARCVEGLACLVGLDLSLLQGSRCLDGGGLCASCILGKRGKTLARLAPLRGDRDAARFEFATLIHEPCAVALDSGQELLDAVHLELRLDGIAPSGLQGFVQASMARTRLLAFARQGVALALDPLDAPA